MSFEAFAHERLQKDLIGYSRKSISFSLRFLRRHRLCGDGLDQMLHGHYGFVPDGTRLRRQPASISFRFNDPWDFTLELWEIEDSHPISDEKFFKIREFANDVFDLSSVFTEVWITDRYGLNRRKVYDVREDLDGSDEMMADRQPHEWLHCGKWRALVEQGSPRN